jgi:hypothetical protein
VGEGLLPVLGRMVVAVLGQLLPLAFPLLASALLLRWLAQALSNIPISSAVRGGRVTVVAAREIPLLAFALTLMYAAERGGVFLASSGLAWLLIMGVMLELMFLIPYAWLLLRLRRDPGSVSSTVICREVEHDLSFLSFLGSTYLGDVAPFDARRWLFGDVRRVDGIDGEAAKEAFGLLDDDEVRLVPHFRLPSKLKRDRTSAAPSLNRYLNSALDAELWDASRNLCRLQPRATGFTWKQFHEHDTVSGRLEALFHAGELVHRIALINVFARAQEVGTIQRLPRDGFLGRGFGDWSRSIRALKALCSPAEFDEMQLGPLGPALFGERSDFDHCLSRLEPFWKILPRPAHSADRSTLSALEVLGEVRNRTVGHGAVGWALTVEPRLYLAALHSYFLQIVAPLSGLDFQMYAWADEEIVAVDGELQLHGEASANCICLSFAAGDDNAIQLDPYAFFSPDGSLLLLNRLTKEGAEYFVTGEAYDRAPRLTHIQGISVSAYFDVEPATTNA